MVGSTDYSHQSLSDMLIDLEDWIKGITETQDKAIKTIDSLTQSGDWNQYDDFRAISAFTMKFLDTAKYDLKEVIDGIHTEIKEYHTKILFSLAKTAREIHDNARKVWSSFPNKKYGDPVFQKVERLIYDFRDMLGDMYDINNLAHRLKDFIGRKVNSMEKNEGRITNIFQAPVTGMQQIFDTSTGTQNIGSSTTDLDELKKVIMEIKELLLDVPKENKEEIEDSITDLEEAIQNSSDGKKSKLRAFGGAISSGLKNLLTIKTLENVEKISTTLPQITENFEETLHKVIGG
ncbi:hypothetical protein [Bacillus mycoides]|uniref:Uncharacterized protein n=1 Tax=Bacillus mycoides (strain KBAB4) TaxID=315730 RepID=A9VJZ3_BACMK|nr:hypothetical protein [Bacillus mycoides]ABY42429.1 hypothetical protein BcerKBAB4_1182 [Bacillus mycoides KBAB4]